MAQLRDYISDLQDTLAAKVQQQRDYFETQLAGLRVYADNKAGAAVRAVMQVPNTRTRAPAKPKYRSKKHKRLKWSGRGLDAGLDARGDEGHEAHEGRFPDQVTLDRS